VVQEEHREAHVPAEQPSTRQEARLPAPDVDACRPGRAAVPPAQGPAQAVGLIWRIRDRRTFDALRRSGRRVRAGALSVTYLAPAEGQGSEDPSRFAFAIPRRVGSAVERNRIRRRLRAALGELARRHPSPIAPGAYLVVVRPEALTRTFVQLTQDVEQAFEKLDRATTTGRAGRTGPTGSDPRVVRR
jgi:ribonuclease P protein component